jgi:ABC-2 type transport system permease protein
MSGAVFIETLRRTWAQTLLWALGLGFLAMTIVLMIPLMDMMAMVKLLESMPAFVRSAVGVGDNLMVITTPEGFVAVGFFGKLALVLAAYPVVMGLRVTANEEEDGILDVLMSAPLPRWRMVVEKLAAYALSIIVIALTVLAGMWLGAMIVDVQLDMGLMGQAIINVTPMLLLILALTALAGAALRRRRDALIVATVFVLGSFMLDTVGSMAAGSAAENLRQISVFSATSAVSVMERGLAWGTIAALLAIALVFSGGAVWAFRRRDIGV